MVTEGRAGNHENRDDMMGETSLCPRTWGLRDKVKCRRKVGHVGLCSGRLGDGRRIVW